MTRKDFPVPRHARALEDYVPGAAYEFGPTLVEEAEVVAFARRFDPQPMHVDADWAKTGPFGGLIASGWHTAAMMMRLIVDHYLPTVASLASPGIDHLRWLQPVRPGDALRVRITVLDVRRSRSKPDRGIVRSAIEVLNQDSQVVMTLTAVNMLRSRCAGGPPGAAVP